MDTDTIVAVATPTGRGGVGVVRVSGPLVPELAAKALGKLPVPRYATYVRVRDQAGQTLDRGLALYFPAPNSFTGEDVLEIQGHGGPVVLDMIVREILRYGARMARPGEFSERAFLNDKMDLAQAEAIADLIDSASEQAARGAVASMEGVFSARVNSMTSELIRLRTYVEATIDFPDEDVEFIAEAGVRDSLNGIGREIDELIDDAEQGKLLREGVTLVLAGRPNVGKSSLMNALSGRNVAIVAATAGTTRDVLKESLQLQGVPVQLVDTAGLRASQDEIELQGISRAWEQISTADHVLLIADASRDTSLRLEDLLSAQDQEGLPATSSITVVRNKIDLADALTVRETAEGIPVVSVSALTGEGLDFLKEHLQLVLGIRSTVESRFIARRRHLDALERTRAFINDARSQQQPELLAEDMRQAHLALGEITGQFTADDLLGKIFSTFCIGK